MSANNLLHCKNCDFVAASQRGLSLHTSKKHTVCFACSFCKIKFSTKGNMTRHMSSKHSSLLLSSQELAMKEIKLEADNKIKAIQADNKIELIEQKMKIMEESKNEMKILMKEQLQLVVEAKPAVITNTVTKVIKNVTHNNNISLITNSLEPITSEKLFRGVKNYSKEAALNNKLPTTTNDVINSLYNQNPRSFIANDKSRNLITWVDGDIKDPKDSIIKDSNGLTLAKKLNHAITEYKNEDPFAPLIEVIENKRLTSNSEEDCMNVIQSTNVIQSFKNKDNNILSKIMTNSNSLIDLAPKTISTPHQLKESLTTLMHEFQKSFILEPFKVIIQSSDAVGQWIRNNLDFFGNVVVNEINMKVVINKEKETEMISFADLFASIRYVLKVVGNQDDETFDFNYLNDHILNKHKKYSPCKEEAIKNAQAFRDWIQTGNFEYQDKLYNMIQKNIRM
jgi:hypothetical protein